MAEQAGLTVPSLPTADDDSRLKSDLIDEIFGMEEPAGPEPGPAPAADRLRTSLEEEEVPPPAESQLETVALDLEDALSGIFGEVEEGVSPEVAASSGLSGDGGEGEHADAPVEDGEARDDALIEDGEARDDVLVEDGEARDDVAEDSGETGAADVSDGQGCEEGDSNVAATEQDAAEVTENGEAPTAENGDAEVVDVPDSAEQDPALSDDIAVVSVKPAPEVTTVSDDDDDIVVLDEIPVAAPAKRKGGLLLGPASKRPAGALALQRGMTTKLKKLLRGPASRRPDFAQLGPPSSRMPIEIGSGPWVLISRLNIQDCSDSEPEYDPDSPTAKMMSEARRLSVKVCLRLNNVCVETSQTVRQWAVTQQQRRDARRRYWEEVRLGPRPQPTPRRTPARPQRPLRGGKRKPSRAQQPPPAQTQALLPGVPASFAATKQLMNLINRGVMQMTSVGGPMVNGKPGPRPPGSRGPVMVSIPTANLPMQSRLAQTTSRSAQPKAVSVYGRRAGGAADLAAIPDLGDKQRHQLLKLLKGNNGTSISAAEPERQPRAEAKQSAAKPAPAASSSQQPQAPRQNPSYCYTTSGSPDDVFSVYLAARQQPEKCFVNMQIDNQCLKVRLPSRPKATGMVFAQVLRSTMEPLCQITVGTEVFVPREPPARPGAAAEKSRPLVTATPPAKKKYPCLKCAAAFDSSEALENHFKLYHVPAPKAREVMDWYNCPLCKNWNGTFVGLREHLLSKHASSSQKGNRFYHCSCCGRSWANRTTNAIGIWLRHVLSHARPKLIPGVPTPGTKTVVPAPVRSRPSRQRVMPVQNKPAAGSAMFPCPQCSAVFPDVSKFPDHWLKAHAGGAAAAPPAPPAAAAAKKVAATRTVNVVRGPRSAAPPEPGFSSRRESRAAAAAPAATATVAAATPAADGAALRCTRCGQVFGDEAAYAQHWINAHTKIRLSADRARQASGAAAAAPAQAAPPPPPPTPPAPDGEQAGGGDAAPAPAAAEEAETDQGGEAPGEGAGDAAAPEPDAAEPAVDTGDGPAAGDATGDAADSAPDFADSSAAPADDTNISALAGDQLSLSAEGDLPAPLAPPDGFPAADSGAPSGLNGLHTPPETVASMNVDMAALPLPLPEPADVGFELSEETLDSMLEQIIPSRRK